MWIFPSTDMVEMIRVKPTDGGRNSELTDEPIWLDINDDPILDSEDEVIYL